MGVKIERRIVHDAAGGILDDSYRYVGKLSVSKGLREGVSVKLGIELNGDWHSTPDRYKGYKDKQLLS